MTREQAKELLSIIQAFAEGNTIQEKIEGITGWEDTDEINLEFEGKKIIHRIKPEPKYRPFKSIEECWNEMHKHSDFGWLKVKKEESYCNIGSIYESSEIAKVYIDACEYDFSDLFNDFTFIDGSPFGIKEE